MNFYYEWARLIAFQFLVKRLVNMIVVPSQSLASYVREKRMARGIGVRVISPGVDTAVFRPLAEGEPNLLREELGLPPDTRLVGMVGRMDPLKGQHRFLEMADLLLKGQRHRYHFVMIGSAAAPLEAFREYHDEVLRIYHALGLEEAVTMLPYRKEIATAIRCLDLLVSPSDSEGFGLVVLEALASGVPVVADRNNGAAVEIGSQKALFMADLPRSAGALARAAERALDERGPFPVPARLQQEFDWGRFTASMQHLFESVTTSLPTS